MDHIITKFESGANNRSRSDFYNPGDSFMKIISGEWITDSFPFFCGDQFAEINQQFWNIIFSVVLWDPVLYLFGDEYTCITFNNIFFFFGYKKKKIFFFFFCFYLIWFCLNGLPKRDKKGKKRMKKFWLSFFFFYFIFFFKFNFFYSGNILIILLILLTFERIKFRRTNFLRNSSCAFYFKKNYSIFVLFKNHQDNFLHPKRLSLFSKFKKRII